jgi:HAD superfamily hydrolase (TIGR01509 family)
LTNLRLNQFSAVIFDMDGLLVDSEIVWHDAEKDFFAARGIAYTDDARALGVGLRIDEFLSVLGAHYGLTEPLDLMVADINARMIDIIPRRVEPKEGANDLIAWLVAHNIPMAVASNSSQAIIETTIRAQGWHEVLRVRCTGDDEAHGKPAPDVYLTAARKLGVEAAASLGLEDSPRGAQAVAAAGMTCLAVPDLSHTNPQAFADITPHVFTNLLDVLEWLKEELP